MLIGKRQCSMPTATARLLSSPATIAGRVLVPASLVSCEIDCFLAIRPAAVLPHQEACLPLNEGNVHAGGANLRACLSLPLAGRRACALCAPWWPKCCARTSTLAASSPA